MGTAHQRVPGTTCERPWRLSRPNGISRPGVQLRARADVALGRTPPFHHGRHVPLAQRTAGTAAGGQSRMRSDADSCVHGLPSAEGCLRFRQGSGHLGLGAGCSPEPRTISRVGTVMVRVQGAVAVESGQGGGRGCPAEFFRVLGDDGQGGFECFGE